MLDAARIHASDPTRMAADAKGDPERRFGVEAIDIEPRVFFRITDNWLEPAVRFIVMTHPIRRVKDAMSRQIVDAMGEVGIGVASTTYDIIGFPTLELKNSGQPQAR